MKRPPSVEPERLSSKARVADAIVGWTVVVMEAYERERRELFGFLLRTTRNREQAEDVLQEAFLKLITVVRAGRQPTDIRAWLFRVAANQVVSAARRRTTMARWAPFLVRPGDGPSMEHHYLEREAQDRVEGALAHLSPDARTALLLAAHGLRTAEVARAIGRSELATRSLLCRSRLRIREQLQREDAAWQ